MDDEGNETEERPARFGLRFVAGTAALSRLAGRVGMAAVLLLLVLMLFEVVARYGFNAPTVWGSELATSFSAAVFLLGWAPTLMRRGHIGIDIVSSRLPARWQAVVEGVLLLGLVAPMLGCLAFAAWQEMTRAYASGEVDLASAWQVPVWPMRLLVAISLGLFLAQAIVTGVTSLFGRRRGTAAPPPVA